MKSYRLNFFFLIMVFLIYSGGTFAQQTTKYLPFAQVMPKPVGGYQAIYKHIEYPKVAKQVGIQGKVYLQVFINKNGSVDHIKVLKGIGGGCDEAAVAGVKQIKFTPGENNGQPVKVKLSLPVTFKIVN